MTQAHYLLINIPSLYSVQCLLHVQGEACRSQNRNQQSTVVQMRAIEIDVYFSMAVCLSVHPLIRPRSISCVLYLSIFHHN